MPAGFTILAREVSVVTIASDSQGPLGYDRVPLCRLTNLGSCSVRIAVNTLGFHPGNRSSTLLQSTQGVLAHLVERLHGMQEATGSTPVDSTAGRVFGGPNTLPHPNQLAVGKR